MAEEEEEEEGVKEKAIAIVEFDLVEWNTQMGGSLTFSESLLWLL